LKVTWTKVGKDDRDFWYSKSRAHDNRWHTIKDSIIQSLQRNSTKGFRQVERDIDGWCSHATIAKWFGKHKTYSVYTERILPLLTTAQKSKQYLFACHLRNYWGIPVHQRKKILWIHYDEKWFWGLVARNNAKMCDELGLLRKYKYAYHKNFINKVMVLAITGYAFEGDIEEGGHGVKIALVRIQAARVAKKSQRASSRDDDGNLRYDGAFVRQKGDVYMVEANVTGSDCGTSNNPKFSLMALFRDIIHPKLEAITGPGGEYEDYIPCTQADKAGPHQDLTFCKYMDDYYKSKGWYLEPQAAQMPYANNLDLCVFPMMSKRHSILLKEYSNSVAPVNAIFSAAEQVWLEIPSSSIASGFILSFRIANMVIEHRGDNGFLAGGSFHADVRRDFEATAKGMVKKKGRGGNGRAKVARLN
jgi:hypothetical protein